MHPSELDLYQVELWRKLMGHSSFQYPNERKLRLEIIDVGERIFQSGLVAGTWGNFSARLDENHFLITPSGFGKGELRPEEMLVADSLGKVVKGKLKPSIETSMHAKIYGKRPDVNAIIHTHPPFATSFASCGKEIPIISVDAASVIGHDIPVAKYRPPGGIELAEEVVRVLGDGRAVLLANHGLVTVAESLEEAYHGTVLAENEAKLVINSYTLGALTELPSEEVRSLRSYYETKYGQDRKVVIRK